VHERPIETIDPEIVRGKSRHDVDERPRAFSKGSQCHTQIVGRILVELLEPSREKTRRSARRALPEELVKCARNLDQSLDEETPFVVGLVDPDRFPGFVRLVVFAFVVKTQAKRELGLLGGRDGSGRWQAVPS